MSSSFLPQGDFQCLAARQRFGTRRRRPHRGTGILPVFRSGFRHGQDARATQDRRTLCHRFLTQGVRCAGCNSRLPRVLPLKGACPPPQASTAAGGANAVPRLPRIARPRTCSVVTHTHTHTYGLIFLAARSGRSRTKRASRCSAASLECAALTRGNSAPQDPLLRLRISA